MVPNYEKLIEVFIGGLPKSIEGNITASKPQTLEEAITVGNKIHKAFPLLVMEFPLPGEVIDFGDSYEAPANVATTGSASDETGKKKGMTVTLTAEDMQKRKIDVKARTTLLLSLPDKHQL
nr:reverse transcriptase domain-containing protein [Tanacetum cinerariifolium]